MKEQTDLFSLLREKTISSAELAQWISDSLGVSLATSYKKMNGQVRLTWEEYKTLERSTGNWLFETAGGNTLKDVFRTEACPVQVIDHWTESIVAIQKAQQEVIVVCHELPQIYLFDQPLSAAYCLFLQFKLQEPINPQSFKEFYQALPERFYLAAKELKETFLKIKRIEVMDPFGFRPFPRGLVQMKSQQFIDKATHEQLTEHYSEQVRRWQAENRHDKAMCLRKLSPIPLLYNFILVRSSGKIIWEAFSIQNLKINPGSALRPLQAVIEDITAASSEIEKCSLSRAYVDKKAEEYQRMLLNEEY